MTEHVTEHRAVRPPSHATVGSPLADRIKDVLDEQEPGRGRRMRWWRRLGAGLAGGPGATFGTPSSDLDEAPPSADQETNMVLSGGGVVRRDGGRPSHKASRKH